MSNRKNLANGILASAVNDTTTTWTLESGYGAGMPDVPFYITATPFGQLPTQGNSEIVNVTARSGDTLTVTRGAKGTTAKAFAAGAVVANAIYDDEKWTSDNIDWATFATFAAVQTVGQSISASSYQKVTFDSVVVNKNNVYNPSTSRFTAPVDGVYEFNAGYNLSGISTQRVFQMFSVNGFTGSSEEPMYRGQDNPNGAKRVIGSCFIPLEAGDYVECIVYTTAPSASTGVGYGHTYFSGSLVART